MPNLEYLQWTVYLGRKAQQQKIAAFKAQKVAEARAKGMG